MKRPLIIIVASVGLLLAWAGCGHVGLTPEGDPNRVVTGMVKVQMSLMPPADAKLTVRLIEPPNVTATPVQAAQDLVIGERGSRVMPEQVIAEQVIKAPPELPVPFRIEFRASDAALRHGFNIEARLSWGGRLRFRNVEAQAITLATIDRPQEIWLESVQ